MSTDRRQFLTHLTLGGVAVSGVAVSALPATLAAMHPSPRSPHAASNEFASLDQPAAQQFDITWANKLTAKYRAVFDVPELTGGSGVWRAGLWSNHYRDLLQAQPTDLNPVIVIRHNAIPFIMTQEFWSTYNVAKDSNVTHPVTEKKTTRNPVLMTAEQDQLSPMLANLTLNKQMERGAIVLACNIAFSSMVALVNRKDKLQGAEARAKAVSMMLPGVILQPNGIFGVTLAQHHGCAFVAAS